VVQAATQLRLNGYTLVELLVVIGIIAVLIAVLLPALSRAQAQANRVVCLSNIRQLGVGILMYCNDNKGYFPTCAYGTGGGYMPYPEDWIHWQANRNLDDSAVAKYVGRGEKLRLLLRCPADIVEGRKARGSTTEGPYVYSYAVNDNIGRNYQPRGLFPSSSRIDKWRVPSKKILLTEGWESLGQPATAHASPLTRRHGTSVFRGNVPGFPEMTKGMKCGSNVSTVFMDAHTESIDQNFAFDETRWIAKTR
jgi:prepilin-type N-terminal cleavage/methylation domain-containing protein